MALFFDFLHKMKGLKFVETHEKIKAHRHQVINVIIS